jgi:hypothetical protein
LQKKKYCHNGKYKYLKAKKNINFIMICSKCGSEMSPIGIISLQDDYAEIEDVFSNVIEKFKCAKCEEVLELRKKLN